MYDVGIAVRWIPGNHDVDRVDWHDRLWVDEPAANLHGRWGHVAGSIVAGLGGVFKERVWYPRLEPTTPMYASRHAYLRQVLRADRWRDGLPLRARDAIFPEDVEALHGLRVDILVTHEAPTTHRHGFVGIDMAAAACCARIIVHGHHHESYEAALLNGSRVHGLAKAEVLRLRHEDLR